MGHTKFWAIAVGAVALLVGPRAGARESAGRADAAVPPASPRLIVKYRPTVEPCAHCPLARGSSVAFSTGSVSLDHLHAALGVRSAVPLLPAGHEPAAARRAALAARLAAAGDRFPERRRRAPRSASVPDLANIFVLELPEGSNAEEAAARYSADPDVVYAVPDREYRLTLLPNDPFLGSGGSWGQSYADLWGHHRIDAPGGWDVSTGSGIVVAVVDTGVDPSHPDLDGKLWTNPGEVAGDGLDNDGNGFVDDVWGWDFGAGDNDPRDTNGHGTHVAGTVAALGDNGRGIAGVAWGARVMAVQGFPATGIGRESDLAQAILYAALNGADVINNSWGGATAVTSGPIPDAVATARALGVVVVAGAGNDAADIDQTGFVPAALPGVIAVGASTTADARAAFSNYGPSLSVVAPGVDVLSLRAAGTTPLFIVAGEYARLTGTSMATPHASAVAALLLAAQPDRTVDEVRWHLEMNADQPGVPGYEGERWNPDLGFGRINAARVFDPVPIAARVRPRAVTRHRYAGTSGALALMDLDFTTHDPVAWSLAAPPWLTAAPAAGVGPAEIGVDFDGTGLAGGQTVSGDVVVQAGDFPDRLRATVHVHRDERSGPEISIAPTPMGLVPQVAVRFAIRAASAAGATVAVWYHEQQGFKAVRLAADGSVTGPVLVVERGAMLANGYRFDLGTDGDNFLLAWAELAATASKRPGRIRAVRFSPDLQPLDPVPRVLDERLYSGRSHVLVHVSVGFDGQGFVVFWEQRRVDARGPVRRHYIRRVGRDGSLPRPRRRRVKLSPPRFPLDFPHLACRTAGGCLIAWLTLGNTLVVPVRDDRVDRRDVRIVAEAFSWLDDIVSDGQNYLLVGRDQRACSASVGLPCEWDVMAVRVTPDGVALDPEGIRINQGAREVMPRRSEVGAAFDGTDYLIAFNRPLVPISGDGGSPGHLFMARLSPDGVVRHPEPEGQLVTTAETAGPPAVGPVGADVAVIWLDRRHNSSPVFHPFGSVFAQRLAGGP